MQSAFGDAVSVAVTGLDAFKGSVAKAAAYASGDQSGGPWLGSGGYIYSRLADGAYRIELGSPAAVGRTHAAGTSVWQAIHDDLTKTGWRKTTAGATGTTSSAVTAAPAMAAVAATTAAVAAVSPAAGAASLMSRFPAWAVPAWFGGGAIVLILLTFAYMSRRKR